MKTYEIEDYDGNTICAFRIDDFGEIQEVLHAEHHDSDGDYIFDTDNQLERIQLLKRG